MSNSKPDNIVKEITNIVLSIPFIAYLIVERMIIIATANYLSLR